MYSSEKCPQLRYYRYCFDEVCVAVVVSHEDRRVSALPAQMVGHGDEEAAEHREQHGDVMRLPGLLTQRTQRGLIKFILNYNA